jgi:hypothetical protein
VEVLPVRRTFAAHDTVRHSECEYARGPAHANSAEGFNDRVRRTISGVFHHISSHHADLYFNEIGFRWSQRVMAGSAVRRTRGGREVARPLWSRIPPALQLSMSSSQRLDDSRDGPRGAASRSSASSLSLGDKGGVRF